MGKIKNSVSTGKHKKSVKTGRFLTANPGGRSHTTKITTKGQITVPKQIREHLKLVKGDRIEFLIGVNGKVTIIPATADIQELKGMVAKPVKKVAIADMNQAIEDEGGKIK